MIKGFNIMKLRFVFLAVMLMLLALPSRADLVYVFTVGDFEYQYTQYEGGRTEVGVAKYNGTSKDVTVPSSVISPSGTEHSVEYIRFDAFRECTFLESVSLPNTIKFLSNEVFFGCTALQSINIPEGLTHILDGCFKGCTALKSITIPNSVIEIGPEAFEGCESLTEVYISNSVKYLNWTFKNCTSLTSVTIPNSITNISNAFRGCTALTSVTIPNSVTNMSDAFTDCKSLSSVILQEGLKKIDNRTFYNCESLKSLTIPASVEEIGTQFVTGCSSLKEISVNENCRYYKSIAGVLYEFTDYGDGNLYYNLHTCPGGYEGSCELPDLTYAIYPYAFQGCSLLNSVTLPKTLGSINDGAFSGCTSLKEITVWNPVPPEMVNGNSVFTDVPVDAVIYVPAGATKRYSEAGGWNYFHDFRELDAVSIFIPDLTISVGETKPIAVEIYTPEGISIVSKLWWSFDPSIATVDENGNVTGVSLGVCQILFMATDNNGIEYMNYGMLAVEKLSAINNISIDNNTTSGHFDIYNLQGICLKRGGTRTDIETLSPGMYIINGKKVMIR